MVLKEEDEKMDFEEPSMGMPTELGMDDMNDSNDELDRMADSFVRQYKEKAIQGIDDDMINGLCDKIRQGLGAEPGYDEERQEEINYGINESVQKIKSTFKRFL